VTSALELGRPGEKRQKVDIEASGIPVYSKNVSKATYTTKEIGSS
jgi:hypothetical protein